MPLKFALYPGFSVPPKVAPPELYQSTMAIVGRRPASRSLNCGLVLLRSRRCGENPDLASPLNARTFAQAERMGLDVMTICGTCQGDERRQSPPEE